MKISLIICTVGNKNLYLEILFKSLAQQLEKNFEVILVDQNREKNKYLSLVNRYSKDFSIKYISTNKGLSLGRNEGLKYASGEIIGFPDDDCYYNKETLRKIKEKFKETDLDLLSIKMINSNLKGRILQKNIKSQEINIWNVFNLTASISIFIRKNRDILYFDEKIGLGTDTIFQGGEDYDIVFNFLKHKKKCYYQNDIYVYHPWDDIDMDLEKDILRRSYPGGASEMYVLNKYSLNIIFKMYRLIRRFLIIIYYIFKRNKMGAYASFYILKGMLDYCFISEAGKTNYYEKKGER